MLKKDVKKRIESLYDAVQNARIPYMVMIYPLGDGSGRWEVAEYFKKDVVKNNTFTVNHYSEYKAPEGFKGFILIDDIADDD